MIIESLRSTQSSLEMGDEIEGNVLSGQDGHPQVCKVAVGSYVGGKAKTKGPTENQQAHVSPPVNHESTDSDSDDSVDRGIEEAILEYLKEKDDHKRKAEPCSTFLQSSKIQRKNLPIPEVSRQNSDDNTFLIASNQHPKIVKETLTTPAVIPVKKYIKNKASLHDNMVKKLDSNRSTTTKSLVSPKEQTKSPSKAISMFNKVKYPVTVKVEEDSNDSSSDDGIEEAIQRYQLEKKEQQNRRGAFSPNAFRDESDSTSDDGIEEAIRCYQLEQLKEKKVLKPFVHKQKAFSKSPMHSDGSTSTENMKKNKMRKKKSRTEKEVKSAPPPPSAFILKTPLSESQNSKGNGFLSFKVEGFKDQPTPAPPKVNTTAELMCAEAILDISKTVMPGVYHHSVDLSSCAPAEPSPSLPSVLPDAGPDDEESDNSSIDSEDGIEQEIRKFLEQKAQMHKQPPSQEPQSLNEAEKMKTKQIATQKKHSRMSLTQRRKQREANCGVVNMSGLDHNDQEKAPKSSPDLSPVQPIAGLHQAEQSGDKSSSLDSDEDLDTAIKDLLKTKKKSKKKTRDLKRNSKKCLKDEEPLLGNTSPAKKLKPNPLSKRSALKKLQKTKDGVKDKTGNSKKNISPHKQSHKSREHDALGGETEARDSQAALHIKDDSSSVDSDDSIEQEIRRFLAEKAKVSTAVKSDDGDVSRNGTVQDEDIKPENQLAEIPRKSIITSGQCPLSSPPQDRPSFPTPDISAVGAQSRLSSVQSCSPGVLEPADGAGAARAEQRRPGPGRGDPPEVASQTERVQPVVNSSAHSRSEAIKWRQSLGLPITDTRTPVRTPFHITSSKINESAPAALPYQSGDISLKPQTPLTAWSSTRTSGPLFPWSSETSVNNMFTSPGLNSLSPARQLPRMSFSRTLLPGHRSQCPMEGETESMVHMPKDKSVFVELESNRTNHVQVRSRDRSEGKERADMLVEKKREGESKKIDDEDAHLERAEEEFIDEAECESGNRRNPEKKQGFSTL